MTYPYFDHSAYEPDRMRTGELLRTHLVLPDMPGAIRTESELFEFLAWMKRDDLELIIRDLVDTASELTQKIGVPEDERISELEADLEKSYADFDELDDEHEALKTEAEELRSQIDDLKRLADVYADDPTVIGLLNKALSTDSDDEAQACLERARSIARSE